MVQIHTFRAKEVNVNEVSLSGNAGAEVLGVMEPSWEDSLDDCNLIFDPGKDLYKDLDALFINFEP